MLNLAAIMWQQIFDAGQLHFSVGKGDTTRTSPESSLILNT